MDVWDRFGQLLREIVPGNRFYARKFAGIDLTAIRSPADMARLVAKKNAVVSATSELFNEERFRASITASTSDDASVRYRINKFGEILKAL